MSDRRGFARVAAEKTQCPQGHPYDDQNTVIDSRGRRRCRICVAEQTRAYQERKRAERAAERLANPPAPKPRATHCAHGHAWTDENTYVTPNGSRQCRQCQRRWGAAQSRARLLRNRALVVSLKGNRCSDCGGEFMSRQLHFHHVDPSTKIAKVSRLIARHSERAIRAEIDKCVVLCAGCHERVHLEDMGDLVRAGWERAGLKVPGGWRTAA